MTDLRLEDLVCTWYPLYFSGSLSLWMTLIPARKEMCIRSLALSWGKPLAVPDDTWNWGNHNLAMFNHYWESILLSQCLWSTVFFQLILMLPIFSAIMPLTNAEGTKTPRVSCTSRPWRLRRFGGYPRYDRNSYVLAVSEDKFEFWRHAFRRNNSFSRNGRGIIGL